VTPREFIFGRAWPSRIFVPILVALMISVGNDIATLHQHPFFYPRLYEHFVFCAVVFGLFKEWADRCPKVKP